MIAQRPRWFFIYEKSIKNQLLEDEDEPGMNPPAAIYVD
jgi:hypothetical protein